MALDSFFKRIEAHYSAQLPFVSYRKPNSLKLNAILQNTDEIYVTTDFKEKGFVFSPFDDNDDTILTPIEFSTLITCSEELPSIENQEEEEKNIQNGSVLIAPDARFHHLDLIKKGIVAIKDKTLDKVVLSRQETVRLSTSNPIPILKNLLNTYASAFVYCWYHPKIGLWLGATPETLLKIEGKRFSMMALAGTQDYKGTLDVKWEEKERQEQQFVTDFIVQHLKPSVEQFRLSAVETVKAGNLVHLKTMITAELKPETLLRHVISDLHPTPAVCGVPKNKSKQFILKHEPYNREFYTGFLGELNLDISVSPRSGRRNVENRAYAMKKRSTQLYVNLRCMQLKNDTAILYMGGGITKDSNPEQEWQETVSKSMVIKNALL
ncbi:chorismate-binding protein [Mariniflexile ostreae]|uniref:Chorismate-binding protein n=1 Tax=Mariniflexile ostreae TaxID=1520892 RepID=A0ABV5FAH2_9FLAO